VSALSDRLGACASSFCSSLPGRGPREVPHKSIEKFLPAGGSVRWLRHHLYCAHLFVIACDDCLTVTDCSFLYACLTARCRDLLLSREPLRTRFTLPWYLQAPILSLLPVAVLHFSIVLLQVAFFPLLVTPCLRPRSSSAALSSREDGQEEQSETGRAEGR
jgi:hypothetical protein